MTFDSSALRTVRIDKVMAAVREIGAQGLWLTNPLNIFYLSGFTGSSGMLILFQGAVFLLTDSRFIEQAKSECPWANTIEIYGDYWGALRSICGDHGFSSLGFEDRRLTYYQYTVAEEKLKGIKLIPIGQMLNRIRAIKDPQEIASINKAANMGDIAFRQLLPLIKVGVSERDLLAEIEYILRKIGSEKSAFEPIVASGERGALPHATASDRTLQNGDLLTLDFGATFNGYCSDMTRTVSMGKPSSYKKKMYESVLNAQLKALESARVGIPCVELDKVARNVLIGCGFGGMFSHGLGHGVGLEVHEDPKISASAEPDQTLQPGMVITIEPGVYEPGVGGVRIEDLILIEDSGMSIFTKTDKQLIEI